MSSLRQKVKEKLGNETFLGRVLAWIFRSPQARMDRKLRKMMKKKSKLRWWLIYGSGRSGTTYMVDMIASKARLKISDWTLYQMLKLTPGSSYIHFDRDRALRDISHNLLDNAERIEPKGDLDLIFKQADMEPHEYTMLVKMWGEPERKIFCFRQPAGYIASAEKLFSEMLTVSQMQELYVMSFDHYKVVGGEPFEYGSHLSLDDYLQFLKPLAIRREDCKPFRYKGEDKDEFTTEAMWNAYKGFKKENNLK